jgi:hypothetical protein
VRGNYYALRFCTQGYGSISKGQELIVNFPTWLRSPAGLTAILSFTVGIIGTITLALEIGHPFGGYLSYSIPLVESGQVAVGTPGWWPIYGADPDFGGDLLTVEGQPYTSNVRAVFAQSNPGDSIIITLKHDEASAIESVDVPVLSLSFPPTQPPPTLDRLLLRSGAFRGRGVGCRALYLVAARHYSTQPGTQYIRFPTFDLPFFDRPVGHHRPPHLFCRPPE